MNRDDQRVLARAVAREAFRAGGAKALRTAADMAERHEYAALTPAELRQLADDLEAR